MSLLHVFDTYAMDQNAKAMHFDVVLADNNPPLAFRSAQHWLQSIAPENQVVTITTCNYCHSSKAIPQLTEQIQQQGYAIIPLEGCPS